MLTLNKKERQIVLASIIVYYLVLIWIIMFKMGIVPLEEMSNRGPYLLPFQFIIGLFEYQQLETLPRQMLVVISNFVLFIPIGLGIGALTNNKKTKTILALVLGSVMEIVQVIFAFGVFDLWDMILNISGIVYGYALLLRFIDYIKIDRTVKILKVLIIIGLVVFILGMAFAIYRLF